MFLLCACPNRFEHSGPFRALRAALSTPGLSSTINLLMSRPFRARWVASSVAGRFEHDQAPRVPQAVPQARKSILVGKKRAQCVSNMPRTGNLPLSGEIFARCTLPRAKGGKKTRSRTFRGEIFFKCARRSVHLANILPDRACFSVLASEIAHGVEILPGRTAHVA